MSTVFSAMKGALQGRSLSRILFYDALEKRARGLSGQALDIAGGANPSYMPLLPRALEVIHTDRLAGPGVTAVDMNAPLPFPERSFEHVFLFNALYIADDPLTLAKEVYRVLKPGGTWLVLSPFIANEMPLPHDYARLTAEGLERLARAAGFHKIRIERQGERATAAAHLLNPFYRFNVIRALAFAKALIGDRLIPARVRALHPTPLQYFCEFGK